MNDSRKSYKLEVRVTLICFILVAIIGGFFSSFVVILNERFFYTVPATDYIRELLDQPEMVDMFVAYENLYVLGFPLHYFLLIVFSWIGATIIGAIWCIVMDRLEEKQRA